MQAKTQAFAELTEQIRGALDGGDWDAIAALDAACSALVSTLRDEDAVHVELRAEIEAMAELYAKLQEAGRSERERLALELTKLSQGKQVTQAYTPLG
ncbi:flagellar protein FliT [Stutzerimonas decontaminans]|uniref:Flagellar protein FliT n=2 Tax=Stutzerimonas TaxID=2901164 RepID=A0ABX4VU28_9GAMM|nr:flagellar protein FliT [Stutzerimonas decontaminans]AHY43290.1 hypothetical protein UIB01_12700 [Stutzerimonas decontaminans]MCQ4246899.1 flagellar protein FliT [Stutzerimonas decontaminans]PNF83674.1 flagellar protein FliT [Stutzerimonas decontaminans]